MNHNRKTTSLSHNLNRKPSKSEQESMRKNPKKYGAEAIAMRRIVVEMGYWLSPFMKDAPLPVLSEWEQTVDLKTIDNSYKNRPPQTHEEYSRSDKYLSSVD
jgi:hypothetical protein